MKTRDRNLLILVIFLVTCFVALFLLMSSKDSKQNVLSPIVLLFEDYLVGTEDFLAVIVEIIQTLLLL